MYVGIVLMCVDCVLAALRITQADPGRQTPPRGHSVTVSIRTSLRQHIEVPKNHNYTLSVRII
jgi:hypothetical protein